MKLRRISWFAVATVSLCGAIACALYGAWWVFAGFALVTLFAAYEAARRSQLPIDVTDWLIALSGKDPFNPDAKPQYQWTGFATTFVAAVRIAEHPLLGEKTLFVFRDELEVNAWRQLSTLIRHGPHATRREEQLASK